ncbi:MAG: PAS domain S-box protein [Spirochaetes bacterium]|nr:PAS domain S-box protein [Spirochaetota bacterium]
MEREIVILHLEDDAMDMELVRATLDASTLRFNIICVRTRAEYIHALRQGCFDIILADYKIPGYDGMSALRLALECCPDVPFIFVSGVIGEDAAIDALTKGATDYVLKQKLIRLVPALHRALQEADDRRERRRAEKAQQRLNRELRAISECNESLVRAENEQCLLGDICKIINEKAGYIFVWVGYAEDDALKTIRPVAWAGTENGYLATARITWDDTERGRGPSGSAIRNGTSVSIQDFAIDPLAVPWRQDALQRGFRSSIALPLKKEKGKTFGVLNIYSTEPHSFTVEETRLLEELAGDLAYGITTLRTRIERKHALEKASQLAAIVQSSEDAIIGKTLDGVITSWNKGAEKIYGYSEQEVLGKSIDILMPPEFKNDRAVILKKIRKGEYIEYSDVVRRRKDGCEVHVSLMVSPVRDTAGRIVSASAIGRDITERRAAEAQRMKMLQTEKLASLGELAAGIAHELTQPLTALSLNSESMLVRMSEGDVERELIVQKLKEFLTYTERMKKLIEHVRLFSREQKDDVQHVFDVRTSVSNALSLMGTQLAKRGVTVSVQLPEQTACSTTGNTYRLEQVIINMLTNARDALEDAARAEKNITITVQREERIVEVHIRDNGTGIPPEIIPRIFDPFYSTKAEEKGTGLGLSISYGIIKGMRGEITVSSEVGVGTEFIIKLPVTEQASAL